jgi:hypothetical protein
MTMGIKLTPDERQAQRKKLGNIRGTVRNAKKKLDSGLRIAKRTGHIWEWRISNILEDVRALISNIEKEEKRLSD